MATKNSKNINNLNKEFLSQLSEKVINSAKQALEKGANQIVNDAKANCPVKTGNLRDSIHAEKQKNGEQYKIVADAKSKSGDIYYGRIVEFSPKGHPYLMPAMEKNKKQILDNVAKAIETELERNKK